MKFKIPIELKYTSTHEWVKVKDDTYLLGITDYAQYQLSDIVYIELPKNGLTFEKGEMIGELESVKAVGEYFMPLSGEILESNQKLIDNPELINNSPYNDGWLLRIKILNQNELNSLLSDVQYLGIIQKEEN